MISKAEAKKAVDAFPQLGGLSADAVAGIKKDLAGISPSMGDLWPSLKKVWDDFHAILQARGEE
jgi:hypothetical protein